jgi:hypothetical protein
MGRIRVGLFCLLGVGMAFPQAAGPIGYWKLDETASPAVDAIADADGTWNGPIQASNDHPTTNFANCGSIRVRPVATAGAVNYVALGRSAALDASQSGSFTISAWYKPNSLPPAAPDLDNQHGIVLKTGFHEGLSLDGSGGFVMGHWTGTDGAHYYTAGYGTGSGGYAAPLVLGQWYHVAGVVNLDPAVRKVFVYRNGQAPFFNAESTAMPVGESANAFYANQPWLLGINDPGGGGARYQADGWIDDVRVYDRALTLTEIQTLASGGTVGDPAVPAATAPTNVQAVGAIGQITVSWDAVSGATGYNVKRSTSSGAETQFAVAPASPFVDTNVNPIDTFFYKVNAIVGCTTSPDSGEVSAKSIPPVPRTEKVGNRHMCGCDTAEASLVGLGALLLLLLAVLLRQ